MLGAIRTATWAVTGPGGNLGCRDDAGTYTIAFDQGRADSVDPFGGGITYPKLVYDTSSNWFPNGVVGTFTVNAPSISTVTLSGAVFDDFDKDGTRDYSESGLSGYEVFIDSTPNSRLDPGELTTTTDKRGRYTFSGLAAGTYRLRIADGKGRAETTGLVTVTARPGTTAYANFGLTDAATIGGRVFNDPNVNAKLDAGESGIGKVVIWDDLDLDGQIDAFEPATQSDASGHYQLTVPAGPQHIQVRSPAGLRITLAPPDSSDGVVGGTSTIDVGLTSKVYIAGIVFNDTNVNGIYDEYDPNVAGGTGYSGAVVYLDNNNNGALDSGEPTRTTTSSGKFRFDGLDAGTYHLRTIGPGKGGKTTLGVDGYNLTLSPGTGAKRTFGMVKGATLIGEVSSNDGLTPMPGVTVYLDANQNSTLDAGEAATTTDVGGYYVFTHVRAGTYYIAVTNLAPGEDADAGETAVTARLGQTVTTNLNFAAPLSVSGEIWTDVDHDGQYTYGVDQTGAPDDTTIWIDLNNNGRFDSASDDPIQQWRTIWLWQLSPGTYHIRVSSTARD